MKYIIIIVIFLVWLLKTGGKEQRYRIWKWHNRDPKFANYIIMYIVSRSKNAEEMKKKIFRALNKKISDEDIYKMVRPYVIAKEKSLEKAMQYRIAVIKKYCNIKPAGPMLDIGTEELIFLGEMKKAYGAESFGINVKGDFSHYNPEFLNMDKDPRFQFYDGINIPWPDNHFSLITILSVVHHIPPKYVWPLLMEIKRVLRPGGYFFVKENDLNEEKYSDAFDIQHEIYEGGIYPGHPSYKNSKTRIDAFMKMGLKKINIVDTKNFTNIYYMLFQK